jgi:hypothetical protein
VFFEKLRFLTDHQQQFTRAIETCYGNSQFVLRGTGGRQQKDYKTGRQYPTEHVNGLLQVDDFSLFTLLLLQAIREPVVDKFFHV